MIQDPPTQESAQNQSSFFGILFWAPRGLMRRTSKLFTRSMFKKKLANLSTFGVESLITNYLKKQRLASLKIDLLKAMSDLGNYSPVSKIPLPHKPQIIQPLR